MFTGQEVVTTRMLFGWEGNRRSGVAPAVLHGLCGISSTGPLALEREMSSCKSEKGKGNPYSITER